MAAGATAAGMAAQQALVFSATIGFGQTVWIGLDLFKEYLAEQPDRIVLVYFEKKVFRKPTTWYQISHKGFIFYTGVFGELTLPPEAEIITVKRLILPHHLWL